MTVSNGDYVDARAVLAFVDIIDSSRHSSYLEPKEYARQLVFFQQLFCQLSERYFPARHEGCDVIRASRGDEGTLFVVLPPDGSEMTGQIVWRAMDFLYHLKTLMWLHHGDGGGSQTRPRRIGVGAGIHVGSVVSVREMDPDGGENSRIEGFNINLAKRVETASRNGRYSRILLSHQAARHLVFQPFVLQTVQGTMKGIEEQATFYEMRSALFEDLDLRPEADNRDRDLAEWAKTIARSSLDVPEEWMISLVISVLDVLSRSQIGRAKDKLICLQRKLAWLRPIEDDPIALYVRSIGYHDQGDYAQEARHLYEIHRRHPEFLLAEVALVIASYKADDADVRGIYTKGEARDRAKELVARFSGRIIPEKRKMLECIAGSE